MRELIGISKEEFIVNAKDKRFIVCVVGREEEKLQKIQKSIEGISQISLAIFDSIEYFVQFLESENNKYKNIAFILLVDKISEIEDARLFLKISNIVSLVLGPDNYAFALEAGQRGADVYAPYELFSAEKLFEFIVKSEYTIKKQKNPSKISVFTGISGGSGTTAIAMNTALIVALHNPFSNVLFLDLSSTKAISNIFFGMPKTGKNIVDILSVSMFDEKSLLENGMYKYSQNLYFIPGIQKHTDRDAIFDGGRESFFTEFLYFAKKIFDVIIIDIGLSEDVNLKTAIQEDADEIFVVSELKTPSISILKTYIELMNKAGWRDKGKIVVNRSDSANVITPTDAKQIINDGEGGALGFDNVLPNDSEALRSAWNEGQLLYPNYKNSHFYKALLAMTAQNFEMAQKEQKAVAQEGGTLLDSIKGMFKWA